MECDHAKALLLDVLLRAKERYSFRVENFVIMGNHFHLIIKPGEHENLSRIMQWILSVYAMTYNKIYGRCGHFWGDRFFSRILYSLEQYLRVFKYIDDNPVSANVQNDDDWLYSGHYHRKNNLTRLIEPLPPFMNMIIHNVLPSV